VGRRFWTLLLALLVALPLVGAPGRAGPTRAETDWVRINPPEAEAGRADLVLAPSDARVLYLYVAATDRGRWRLPLP